MRLDVLEDLFKGSAVGEALADRVAADLSGHPSRWYTTQELAWGISALGKRTAGLADASIDASLEVGGKALARTNPANGLLDSTGRRIDIARRTGWIDTIQQTQMEAVLVDIANAQGGMERLKNTPLPVQYRYLPTIFTHLRPPPTPSGCLRLPLAYLRRPPTAPGCLRLRL